ncbi:MAG: hypothetical protein SF172_04250 [Burkholderiales bacterium]|nr:hypothetical protein [Burkholderiales bacterium]
MQVLAKKPPTLNAAMAAVRDRRGHLSNVHIFQSPKNECRLVIKGDIAFMVAILLEGDPNVVRYLVDPPAVQTVIEGESRGTQVDFAIWFEDGHEEWWECKRARDARPGRTGRAQAQLSAQAQAAQMAGIVYRVVTDEEVQTKIYLFDNWLTLCGAITRARGHPCYVEQEALRVAFGQHGRVTLATLLERDGIDQGAMLGLIGKLLQQGTVTCDLDTRLFGLDSIIERRAP